MVRDIAGSAWLRGSAIAHRGLHDLARGRVENSMSAFEAAINAGYAIECDLRLSRDGEPIVFHDAALDRLTDRTGTLHETDAVDLMRTPLFGSSDLIPHLRDLLDLTRGRVPLLLELKTYDGGHEVGTLEHAVARLCEDYDGPLAIQSFHPGTVAWFARHARHIPRGFLSQDYRAHADIPIGPLGRFALRQLLAALPARATFIGYDAGGLHATGVSVARWLGLPVLAWTVRSAEEAQEALTRAHSIIFEGFLPAPRVTSCA